MSRTKSKAMSFAIPDRELERVLREMVSPIASVAEDERLGYFRGWERIARQPHREGFYDIPKLAGKAMGIASIAWREYPPQDAPEPAGRTVPAAVRDGGEGR